jgi:predicted nuclease of predicted toxin-antitoxin system
MKFLVDAQLPEKLARFLSSVGHSENIEIICRLLEQNGFVEVTREMITVHN